MKKSPLSIFYHPSLSTIWTCLAIFLIAFLPRILALDVFLTQDEPNWVKRSVKFFSALLSHDWPGTSQSGHPGVTTMWTGTLGLAAKYFSHAVSEGIPLSRASLSEFLQAVPIQLVDASYLAPMRLPTVLATSVFAVALYLLVRKLFDGRVALLSATLVALDPFYLAHSRLLHHDALVTTFMTLSVLSFMIYLRQDHTLFFLVFSGLMAGLAFLSKATAFFLMPFMGLLIVMSLVKGCGRCTVHWKEIGSWAARLLIWMGMAILVFVLLWPAMWVDPAAAVGKIVGKVEWSQPLTPYPSKTTPLLLLKYPAVWLLRTTPLTLAGAVAALWFLGRKFRRDSHLISTTESLCQHSGGGLPEEEAVLGREERENLMSLVLYIVLFTLALSAMGSKLDRYLLPAFPALDIVSAWGWLQLQGQVISALASRFSSVTQWSKVQLMIGFVLAFALQAGFSATSYPYYLTFFNPMIYNPALIGEQFIASSPPRLYDPWGEGLDQAARYLNQKENSANLTVAVAAIKLFSPFFLGKTVEWSEGEERNFIPWHTADYVVRYINFGGPERAYDYFCSLEPEHVVRLNGLDYAWIYKMSDKVVSKVVPAQFPQSVQFGDSIVFLGHSFDLKAVNSEGQIGITLYWQCLSPMGENYTVYLKVLNGSYHVYGQQDGMPVHDGFPTNQWERGIVVKDERQIKLLPGTPPGLYDIEVSLYDPYSQRSLEPQSGRLVLPIEIPLREPPAIETLDIAHPMTAYLNDKVKFLGYNVASSFHPGHGIHLDLFWQALQPMKENYTVFTHLIDKEGTIWGQKDNPPVDGFYPTTFWTPGEIVRDQYDLMVSPDTPPGQYWLAVGMYLPETGERLEAHGEEGPLPENQILLPSPIVIR